VPFTPSDGQWFNALPFRLEIVERPGEMPDENQPEACSEVFPQPMPPRWDEVKRVLTVFLAKGEIARVQYSSFLGQDDLPKMGLLKWLTGSNGADLVKQYGLAGQAWQLTPFRELKLVHAVQQPLCPPRINQLAATRDFGESRALLTGRFYLSVKSTGQLDLLAEWDEATDDPSNPAPQVLPGKAHVFQLKIEESDTDHYELQDVQEIYHEFSDTKFRRLRYHLNAASRFREYFPPEISLDAGNISREGRELNVIALSSARPAAPKLQYVVPTFGWSEESSPPATPQGWQTFKRFRAGGGLRVYLDRPWFSSGDGELLGVVLWPGPGPVPTPLEHLVTQMGADPIWFAAQPKFAAHTQDFTNELTNEDGLILDEAEGQMVSVVGFKPEFDPERRLWYCDIRFAAPFTVAYYPFVRLALARYQPNSLKQAGRDVKLSRVIIADFVQLPPDRELALNLADDKTLIITLAGFAPRKPLPNLVEISLETHDSRIPGELGWHPVAAPTGTANPFKLSAEEIIDPDFHFRLQQTIILPAPRTAQPFRVSVKEFEQFSPDPLVNLAANSPDRTGGHVKRLVYADAVEL
jgi:hypothetical protein